MKVYCSRCKFYVPGYTIPYSFGPPNEIKEKCMCPENFYDMYVSEKVRPKSKPSIINRFNNCKWYIPIGWDENPYTEPDFDLDDCHCDCCSSISSCDHCSSSSSRCNHCSSSSEANYSSSSGSDSEIEHMCDHHIHHHCNCGN